MKKIILILLILIILLLTSCTLFEKEKIYEPQIIWEYVLEHTMFQTSPSYYDGKVYVLTGKQFITLDALTGEELWSLQYSTSDSGLLSSMYPEIDVKRNTAYFSAGSRLYAVDLENEEFKYITDLNPLIITRGNSLIFRDGYSWENAITLYKDELYLPRDFSGTVVVCDPETGEVKRFYDLSEIGGSTAYLVTPELNMSSIRLTFEDDIMYVPTYYYVYALDISKQPEHSLKSINYDEVYLWRASSISIAQVKGPLHLAHSQPLIVGDYVYLNSGTGGSYTYKLDKRTGELIWEKKGSDQTGMIYFNGKVIGGSYQSYEAKPSHKGLRALDAHTGEELWRSDFRASSGGMPVLYNGKIYSASEGIWYCVDAQTGKSLWSLTGSGYSRSKKTAVNEKDDILYFTFGGLNKVIAIKPE